MRCLVENCAAHPELHSPERCFCRRCIAGRDERNAWGMPLASSMMILCATCGNKRCPHANDHANFCTGSNATGQPGSAYP